MKISWIFNSTFMNLLVIFPCLRGWSDCCHSYASLHTLANLTLVLNVAVQQLFVLCTTYHVFKTTVFKRHADKSTNYWYCWFFIFYRFLIVICKRKTTKEIRFPFFNDGNRINQSNSNQTSSSVSFRLYIWHKFK